MSSQISALQEQVNLLYEHLNQLRSHMSGQLPPQQGTPIDPSLQYPAHRGSFTGAQPSPGGPISPSHAPRPRASSHSQHRFKGPTSSAFNLGVAKSSLQSMGITGQEEEANGSGEAGTGTTDGSPRGSPHVGNGNQVLTSFHIDKDPIWSISQEETLRLCRVYEDEIGVMYPVLDVNKLIDYAVKLYKFMEAAHRSGLMQQGLPGADAIDDEDTNILKVVLATAMTVEASGRSELGQKMFEYVQPAIDTMLLGAVGVKAIRLLTMTVSLQHLLLGSLDTDQL